MQTHTKSKAKGLTSTEAELSRKKHGSNELAKAKSKSFLRTFFENLGDPVIRILLGALIVNLFLCLPRWRHHRNCGNSNICVSRNAYLHAV